MNNILLNNSSQPYLYNTNDMDQLLYCYADAPISLIFGNEYLIKPWKIKYKNLTNDISLVVNTPNSDSIYGSVILECNPQIIYKNNLFYLYYTAGFNKGDNEPILYHLCCAKFNDSNLQNLVGSIDILQKTFTGCIFNDYIVYTIPDKSGVSICKKNLLNNHIDILSINSINFNSILRISKIYNQNNLIITGYTENHQFISILVDENFDYIKTIVNNNNENVYKCTLLNNKLIYTIKEESDSEIEKRHLVQENYTE